MGSEPTSRIYFFDCMLSVFLHQAGCRAEDLINLCGASCLVYFCHQPFSVGFFSSFYDLLDGCPGQLFRSYILLAHSGSILFVVALAVYNAVFCGGFHRFLCTCRFAIHHIFCTSGCFVDIATVPFCYRAFSILRLLVSPWLLRPRLPTRLLPRLLRGPPPRLLHPYCGPLALLEAFRLSVL